MTDMQGRLQGKRLHAPYFLDQVARTRHRGLQLPARRRRGHEHRRRLRDGFVAQRLRRLRHGARLRHRLRHIPWHPGTAMVQADVLWEDGTDVAACPRQVLKAQLARLAGRGLAAFAGTELEFITFVDSYEQAWTQRVPRPAPRPTSTTSTTPSSAPPASSRCCAASALAMAGAGMYVESVKGECNFGQHEIVFKYADALTACDNHVVYKTGAKEIAAQEGMAITFMAKYDQREGNSCHIHLSLRGTDGCAGAGRRRRRRAGCPPWAGRSSPVRSPTCGNCRCCSRPTSTPSSASSPVRSPRPRSSGAATTAPAPCDWSATASRCAWRTGCRAATSTPTLSVAAMVAAGLDGIENGLSWSRR